MYYVVHQQIIRSFIEEVRKYWSYDPRFNETLVENIQDSYSYESRPALGIIIKPGGSSQQKLTWDNFKNTVMSYCHLVEFPTKPALIVEWVREDALAIQRNAGVFPSIPGVYYFDVVKDQTGKGDFAFYIDPLYDVQREIHKPSGLSFNLINVPIERHNIDRTPVRLYEMPNRYLLNPNSDYTVVRDAQNKPTGEITLPRALSPSRWLVAQYRYEGDTIGPISAKYNHSNSTAIPGVVLAFGDTLKEPTDDNSEVLDSFGIVVGDYRSPSYLEYGGRWSINLDLEIFSRDLTTTRHIADKTLMYVTSILRSYFSTQGYEIMDVSLGAESEEIYNDTEDSYFYTTPISVTVETEWSVFVPITVILRDINLYSLSSLSDILSDDELAALQSNIRIVDSNGFSLAQDPFYVVGNKTFEGLV